MESTSVATAIIVTDCTSVHPVCVRSGILEPFGGPSAAARSNDGTHSDKAAATAPVPKASRSPGSSGRDFERPPPARRGSSTDGDDHPRPRPTAQVSSRPSRPQGARLELTSTPAAVGHTAMPRSSTTASGEASLVPPEDPEHASTMLSEKSKTSSTGAAKGHSRAVEELMKNVNARKAREMLQASHRATNPVTIMRDTPPPGTLLDSKDAAAAIASRKRKQQDQGRDDSRHSLEDTHTSAEAWRNQWKSSQSLVDGLGSRMMQDRAAAQRYQAAAALQAEAAAHPAQHAQGRIAILKLEKAVLESDAGHIQKQLTLERRVWEADEVQLADRLQRLSSEAEELRIMVHEAERMRRRLQDTLLDERRLKERAILLAREGLQAEAVAAPPQR